MRDKTSKHQESSRKLRIGVRSITLAKANLKEIRYVSKQILRKLSKFTENKMKSYCLKFKIEDNKQSSES